MGVGQEGFIEEVEPAKHFEGLTGGGEKAVLRRRNKTLESEPVSCVYKLGPMLSWALHEV